MFSKITVLGAGTMGHGIAHVCAMAGYRVVLYDISTEVLENAINSIATNLNKANLQSARSAKPVAISRCQTSAPPIIFPQPSQIQSSSSRPCQKISS